MAFVIHEPVRTVLRLEGLALLGVSVMVYAQLPLGWAWFAALFLWPDLALLAYLRGPRLGALAYNLTHSSLGAYGLLALGLWQRDATLIAWACIWLAHIGFDRAFGFGLKYSSGFQHTHLGVIKAIRPAAQPVA
jgi:hypothetical protein